MQAGGATAEITPKSKRVSVAPKTLVLVEGSMLLHSRSLQLVAATHAGSTFKMLHRVKQVAVHSSKTARAINTVAFAAPRQVVSRRLWLAEAGLTLTRGLSRPLAKTAGLKITIGLSNYPLVHAFVKARLLLQTFGPFLLVLLHTHSSKSLVGSTLCSLASNC